MSTNLFPRLAPQANLDNLSTLAPYKPDVGKCVVLRGLRRAAFGPLDGASGTQAPENTKADTASCCACPSQPG